jgi:uncharacterized protein
LDQSATRNFSDLDRREPQPLGQCGALSSGKLGWLNWERKQYESSVSPDEQVELLSLIGDVALKDGEPQVHAHAVIGKRDGTGTYGESEHLKKEFDPAAGIALTRHVAANART